MCKCCLSGLLLGAYYHNLRGNSWGGSIDVEVAITKLLQLHSAYRDQGPGKTTPSLKGV